jgi:predicted HTH domain antitoxin
MRLAYKFLISTIFILLSFIVEAQTLTEKEISKFQAAEAILKIGVDQFKYDTLPFEQRVELIHDFIPKFVAILKEKNSYLYPFDNLESVVKITAPDNSFRIFTWQLKEPLGTHKYYGALQKNSEELILFPLFDYSDTMDVHPQTILTHNNWYGAIYYNCLVNEVNGKNYYTLMGFDEADFVSNRKVLEIVGFDEAGKPEFGAPLLSFTDSNQVNTIKNRLFLEYNDKASMRLNFDMDLGLIVYDHLVAPSQAEEGAWFTYVPDGTYEGLAWKNNIWTWVEKIFTYSINEPDSPPMPHPILNDRD